LESEGDDANCNEEVSRKKSSREGQDSNPADNADEGKKAADPEQEKDIPDERESTIENEREDSQEMKINESMINRAGGGIKDISAYSNGRSRTSGVGSLSGF